MIILALQVLFGVLADLWHIPTNENQKLVMDEFRKTYYLAAVLGNNTQGNQSYIDKLSQFSALSLLSKVERVLIDIANIDFNPDFVRLLI
ncbi:hypothetical protein JOC59_001695 [Weissella beninensis]|uniref:hypothetical protein n=1 Tax=Periweissella beninensis TaxID=504936 RepID=UPI00195FF03A|nr:hypothetical protein [Periweissella beninensis]MBM7544957.1 hypothetical protein [Periweissella beninensis]